MTDMTSDTVDDGLHAMVIGHLLIRDKDTGEVLINQRDNHIQQSSIKGENDANNR